MRVSGHGWLSVAMQIVMGMQTCTMYALGILKPMDITHSLLLIIQFLLSIIMHDQGVCSLASLTR